MSARIAIVDDDEDSNILLGMLLGEKYQVTPYLRSKDALEAIKKLPPDVVFLDISMPEMSGVEVLEHIRSTPSLKHLPIIAVTAYAMQGDREKYLKLGFDDYVSKPITDDAILIRMIDKILASKNSSRQK